MEINEKVILNTNAFDKVYEKMVYIALHLRDNISIKELSDICVCSKQTVRQAIKKLEELELVSVERQMDSNGSFLSNQYRLLPVPKNFGEEI